MKKQNSISIAGLFLIMAFAFSSCRTITFENNQLTATPTPNEKIQIKNVDFNNFIYSDKTGKAIFSLTNGEQPFGQMKDIAYKLENLEYSDLTDDNSDEAIIHISIQYGGSDKSGLLYVFTLENNKSKMLWYLESGYGADGGLKQAYAENNNLIVELFGDNKFEENTGEFKFPNHKDVPKDLCCPTSFTRFRFRWIGEKFVLNRKPKLFNTLKKENR